MVKEKEEVPDRQEYERKKFLDSMTKEQQYGKYNLLRREFAIISLVLLSLFVVAGLSATYFGEQYFIAEEKSELYKDANYIMLDHLCQDKFNEGSVNAEMTKDGRVFITCENHVFTVGDVDER